MGEWKDPILAVQVYGLDLITKDSSDTQWRRVLEGCSRSVHFCQRIYSFNFDKGMQDGTLAHGRQALGDPGPQSLKTKTQVAEDVSNVTTTGIRFLR